MYTPASGAPDRFGPYRIVSPLGSGGMGHVYLALDTDDRPVAVKVVRPEFVFEPEYRARFAHEVRRSRQLGGVREADGARANGGAQESDGAIGERANSGALDGGVVGGGARANGGAREATGALDGGGGFPRVLDADTRAPAPWSATEFVPGPSLREVVRRSGALPEPAVRRLGRGIAQALVGLHSAGVVHRDLKPGNVLITADGARVIDLGISGAVAAAPTENTADDPTGSSTRRTGAVGGPTRIDTPADVEATGFAGTPGYAAPETARGEPSGPAADVFSLGAVLVFALTGHGPFGDGHPSAVLYRVEHRGPDLDGVPPSLIRQVSACLDKDPDRRPTARDLLRALGDPVPAAPSDAWLPPGAVDVLDGFTRHHEAAVRHYLSSHPRARAAHRDRSGPRTRTLLGVCAAAFVLLAGTGLWAVSDPLDSAGPGPLTAERRNPEQDGGNPDPPQDCAPTLHLAPEYTRAAADAPAVPSDAASVRFSSDGSVLAVHLQNNVVHLWDWRERTALAAVELDGDVPFREIEFSPDDCYLAHGSRDGAQVYSLRTGERTVHLAGRDIRSVAFSPDGTTLAMADRTTRDDNGGIYTADLASGEVTRYETESPRGHGVAYSPSGARLAAQDGKGDLRVWDTTSGEELRMARNLPFPRFRALDFLDEDVVFTLHALGPLVVDVGEDEGGLYYEPDEPPPGDTAKVAVNPVHRLAYALYMSDVDDEGGATLGHRVLDLDTAEDVTPEVEEGSVGFALLDVHPDGDVIATLPPQVDEVQIRDAVTLELLDTFT
ncbi:serine/threonine-protein kinase [Nocardiopsis sp. NPDC007018]|uniref:WD40 repeat domain-containing serine/threonine protein kinase n=1 Tax=Nocardiopsis sp. NPDC007018 TaxID=3155721 RepID=UPI0033E4C2BF